MDNTTMEVNVEAAYETKVAGLWFDKIYFWKKFKLQAASELWHPRVAKPLRQTKARLSGLGVNIQHQSKCMAPWIGAGEEAKKNGIY